MKALIKVSKYLICFLVLCGSLYLPVNAQKLPIALQDNTPLSPINKSSYDEVAQRYMRNPTTEDRDKLVFMAISQIDLNFGFYIKNKRQKNSLFQTVMDILEVGAATAISITNGERPKSIIADALGFVQGSRSKINKNLQLLEQQVLVNKMIEKRSVILKQIIETSGQYTDAQYPFERMFIDVVAYYEAGTKDSALSELSASTGAAALTAQQQLATAKRARGIFLAPSAVQIKTSRENSDFVQAIIDRHVAAAAQITDAETKITAANAIITRETATPSANAADLIAQANTDKTTAQAQKTAALAVQKKSLDDLTAIFKSVEADPQLSKLLDSLPEKFPNIASRIEGRLARIRAGTGSFEDYAFTVRQLLLAVVDAIPDNPTIVERTKTILDSVK
jgi:hypothetical protein